MDSLRSILNYSCNLRMRGRFLSVRAAHGKLEHAEVLYGKPLDFGMKIDLRKVPARYTPDEKRLRKLIKRGSSVQGNRRWMFSRT
jgi:hypothetical protein